VNHIWGGDETIPWVMVQAEVDGHRGTFSFDTGSPLVFLNSSYLRSTPTGGLDTLTTGSEQHENVTIHTLRIGTLVQHIDSTVTGLPPKTSSGTNAQVRHFPADGELGNLGLTAMEPFETIIDYVHQRIIFIRLDKAGRRLVEVPAYTPAGSVPLVPSTLPPNEPEWWGIQVHHGTAIDSVIVDTGSPHSDIGEGDQQQAADELKQTIAASHNSGTSNSIITLHGDKGNMNLLCYPFLNRLGVIGFNFRAHQFILYR
jgi:hypothetical protein